MAFHESGKYVRHVFRQLQCNWCLQIWNLKHAELITHPLGSCSVLLSGRKAPGGLFPNNSEKATQPFLITLHSILQAHVVCFSLRNDQEKKSQNYMYLVVHLSIYGCNLEVRYTCIIPLESMTLMLSGCSYGPD